MINPYIPKIAKIKKIQAETPDMKLFTFEFVDKKNHDDFAFRHGQFLMLGILGHGEAPFDICSSSVKTSTFDLAVRRAGALTEKLHQLKAGDLVAIRGPFGNGLPLEKFKGKDLLLIGGGCGFVTMRSFVQDYLDNKLNIGNLKIFYGCLDEQNLLFKNEYASWRKKVGLEIALSRPSNKWSGKKGLVTALFNDRQDFSNTVVLVVGPPIMYRPVVQELKKKGVADENIYLSLERRMYCGIGVCQHCAVGPYYVCKDGPVFSWAQLKDIEGAV